MKSKIIFIVFVLGLLLLISCKKNESEVRAKATIDSLQHVLNVLNVAKDQLEANKKLVADLYQELFGDKNVEAIDKYIGENYIQHNPILPDGRDVLKQGATQWFKGAPKEKIDIRHLSAEGDLVYIHTRATFGRKVSSVIDIFRIENNKIVEHWDVIQAVPEKSASPHPMF